MEEITKAEFLADLELEVIEWPPVQIGTKLYGKSYRGNAAPNAPPFKFVWCNV